jgi:DNA-binding response OmpR family regulator
VRVLVVENDPDLGAFLRKGIENEGHSAEWLDDGDAALRYAAENQPDLIVLDLGLPDRDGVEILAALQEQGSASALLVLTGRSDLHARVQCLDMGADDCLLKPFSFLEFTARCRALLRRRAQLADQVLRSGDLELDRVKHQVSCAGREIDLTAKEFALLEYLMLRRGESVSRSELLANVWKLEAETGTNIVDVYVNYVRRKLEKGAGPGRGKLIATVRGTGYRVGSAPAAAAAPKNQVVFRPALPATPPPVEIGPPLAANAC